MKKEKKKEEKESSLISSLDKLISRISLNSLNSFFLGVAILSFSIGSIYSIKLVRYAFYIMIVFTLSLVYYVQKVLIFRFKKEEFSRNWDLIGFTGFVLLILFFGIQSPQLFFKNYLWILGLLFMIPFFRDLFRK